jgi:hypothetical protein
MRSCLSVSTVVLIFYFCLFLHFRIQLPPKQAIIACCMLAPLLSINPCKFIHFLISISDENNVFLFIYSNLLRFFYAKTKNKNLRLKINRFKLQLSVNLKKQCFNLIILIYRGNFSVRLKFIRIKLKFSANLKIKCLNIKISLCV